MNPVLILTRNGLELTKRCVESVRNQDIETAIYHIVNGADDRETQEWFRYRTTDPSIRFPQNEGVSRGWNCGLTAILSRVDVKYCLVLNNDVVLPSYFYRELLAYN